MSCGTPIARITGKSGSSARARSASTSASAPAATIASKRVSQRTRSQFHPTLGIFAEMAERSWYPVTKLGQRVNGTEPMLLEIGGSGSAPYVIRNEYTPVILSGTAQSQLKGRRADPTGSNPNRQIPYWITVGHQGYTAICQQSPYNATSSCENWYLSLDAKTALSIDENGGRTFFQSIPPKRNASLRIFEKLAQRYFRSPDGRYKSFDQQDNYAAMRNYTRDGTVTEVCSYVPEKQSGTCGYSTNRNVVFGVEANGFTLEGSRYRLEPGALIITDSAGVEKRWTELSRGNAALAWQDVKVEKEHREAMREYRRIQREEAKRNAESAAAWQALAQNILTGAYANKSYQPAPQSVWAARVAPGGVAQPSGYAQSMGVTHPTPPRGSNGI